MRPGVVISAELGARSLLALLYRRSPEGAHSRLVLWATLSERSEQGRGSLREGLRRLLLWAADGVIVNGESGARYARHLGARPNRLFRVPQTVDVEEFMRARLEREPASGFRLLYVGSLEERKGLQSLVTALSRWAELHPEREIEFWIAGSGPLEAWLSSLATPPNLSVRLLGQIPYKDLPRVYAECGIFVFPTLADEWGLVVNEAMASGLPVLGSVYSQAVEELVEDGVNGWVFRPDRSEELYQALERVFSTPAASLDRMRVNARRRVEKLTPDCVADQICKVIENVCRSNPTGS
jgi:glycosyltransferase involved in cell wall biosynthesis